MILLIVAAVFAVEVLVCVGIRWRSNRAPKPPSVPAPTPPPGRLQPAPRPNNRRSCHDLVVKDMLARKALGLSRYGTLLQAGNGRDALWDAYEEVLDLAAYLRQEIEERELVARFAGDVGGPRVRRECPTEGVYSTTAVPAPEGDR